MRFEIAPVIDAQNSSQLHMLEPSFGDFLQPQDTQGAKDLSVDASESLWRDGTSRLPSFGGPGSCFLKFPKKQQDAPVQAPTPANQAEPGFRCPDLNKSESRDGTFRLRVEEADASEEGSLQESKAARGNIGAAAGGDPKVVGSTLVELPKQNEDGVRYFSNYAKLMTREAALGLPSLTVQRPR